MYKEGEHIDSALNPAGTNTPLKVDETGALITSAQVTVGDITVSNVSLAPSTNTIGVVKVGDDTATLDIIETPGANAAAVILVDSNGDPLTSLGGGGSSDASAANQLAIIDAVNGIEPLLSAMETLLSAIQTSVQLIDNSIAGSETQVDIVGSLPAGSNAIGSVGVNSLPGTIAADTTAMKNSLDTIDNAISGTNMQVAVTAALPAGTSNIGDVDVLTVPLDPFGTNADVVVAAGAAGSMQAKLRRLTTDLATVVATLSDGTQKATVRAGAKGSTTAADVTSTPSGANHQPLDVILYDAAGVPINLSGIGGGTQYVTGNGITATPTGTVILYRDGTNIARSISPGTPLPTQITDGTTAATVRSLANSKALNVAVVDASGAQLPSIGGGTQYAHGAPVGTPTSTAAGWWDGTQMWTVSPTKPFPVNGTFSLSGEDHIGEVGGRTSTIQPAWTISTSPAYSVGDVIGGKVQLTGAVRKLSGTGVFQSLNIVDIDNRKPALDILVLNADPTSGTYTDNGPFTLAAGDAAKVIGKISIAAADWKSLGSTAFGFVMAPFQQFTVFSSITMNLWMLIVVQSAVSAWTATGNLKMAAGILND